MLLELLTSLLLAGMMPWLFFWGNCPCCGAGTTTCTGCSGGSDNTPNQVQVVIAGLSNDFCGDCTSWNGTFIADYQAESPLGTCNWYYAGDFCSTPAPDPGLYLTAFQGGVSAAILDDGPGKEVHWFTSLPLSDKPDCLTWSSYSVNFSLVLGSSCSGTPTCNITTL